ncbi:MAG: ArsR family transcriptional regulator [Candidatus Heimdallarchaeota archaeon]|nr:ArsR family transcriptional regulator [Candidatus Heimdallarchaeota archaeon]MBY8993392.1 ArsR family transcriptional regulator [Candidatus Heimdallarchaeota archaeon]
MSDPDKIFLALKSETRRKILSMLASEPMYLTQLAFNLNLGQQAIFRHLQLLEESGLLDSDFKDAGQGAPRRYYQIARAVRVEVQISPEMFDVGMFDVPSIEISTPKDFPELAEIVTKCAELGKTPNSKEKLSVFSDLLKELSKELSKVNIAKSIAEATYSNIRRQIRAIAFDLLPQRIDQRIIQTLASRGGESTIEDLSLILNLTIETIEERMIELDKAGLIKLEKKNILLL